MNEQNLKLRKIAMIVLLLILCLPVRMVNAYAQQQLPKVSISVEDMPVRDFLANIEKQCKYTFFYSSSILDGFENVNVDVKDRPVDEVLNEVFEGTGRTIEIIGNKIAIKIDNSVKSVSDSGNPASETDSGKEMSIKGKIVDENGVPMAGVGVMIVGTLQGTISGEDGSYSINALSGQEIQFNFLGYEDLIVKVGEKQVIDVTMIPSAQALESVVVTALGIKRDEKSIGYAASKVDSERFSNSVTSSNWVGGLAGQVAGLSIGRSNSGPGGSMRVTLRGESSSDLSNNGALFVIDGVPMYNTSTASASGSNSSSSFDSIDYGDGTSDVNPEDIESITVLKGPAATALYGSNAANGAIIITTKSHNSEQGSLSVSFSQNLAFETVLTSPDLQYEYGQGNTADYYYYLRSGDGERGAGFHPMTDYANTVSIESWGPRLDGSPMYQYYNEKLNIGGYRNEQGDFIRTATPFESKGDWFKDYFNTGYSFVNSLGLSGRLGNKSSLRMTISDFRNRGITSNTPSNRQFISIKARSKPVDWLSIEANMNYRRQDIDNIPTSSGYGSTSIMYSLWSYAPNVDMDWAENYWLDGKENLAQDATLSGGKNNAYFSAYQCVNTQMRNRIYGNIKFDLDLYKGLTLMLRAGIDNNSEFRTQRHASSTQANPEGWYREQNIGNTQYSGDFLLKYDRRLGSDFRITANFGGSILNQSYRKNSQIADKLKQPGVYTLANSLGDVKVDNYGYERQTNSLYGLLQFSWKNALFLDVTGRNDWSSTLPVGNNSYFYPSVSGSVVLNDLFDFGQAENVIDLMKLRASWAQVGHDTAPYRIDDYLSSTKFPGTVNISGTKSNNDLKPEIVTSWEVGLDLRMFRNRLNLDIAYYDGTSRNLISHMPLSYSTGVSGIYTNAGSIRNWGVELSASGTLIKTGSLQWKVGFNWAMNRNEVLSLGEGIDSWIVARYSSHASMVAYEGGSLTSMYGKGYKRAPEGSYAIDANGMMQDVSGKIVLDDFGRPLTDEEMQYIGECSPKWQGGFNTSFEYKGVKLSISFDGKYGGNVYSYTNYVLNYRGKGVNTLPGREGGMVPDGVVLLSDGNYKINDFAIPKENISEYYHAAYSNTNCEANFVSTSFLKLREVRLEYSFPKRLLASSKVIQGLSFAVYGNNLVCWSKFPGWDPEGLSIRGSAIVPGFELMQMPSGAQFGASWKITF